VHVRRQPSFLTHAKDFRSDNTACQWQLVPRLRQVNVQVLFPAWRIGQLEPKVECARGGQWERLHKVCQRGRPASTMGKLEGIWVLL
jgi:hypothetical protein